MSFAFPALIIFLLSLPGLILRYTYSRGFFRARSRVSFRPITDEIGYSVVIASVMHLVWCFGVTKLGFSVDFESVLILLTGYDKDREYFGKAIASFSNSPFEVSFYFLSLYAFSGAMGYLIHHTIRRLRWDCKYISLRFRNEWFYLLTGEMLNFKEAKPKQYVDVQGTYLSCVVHQGGTGYLYRGIIKDFYFDQQGNLDRILLVAAQRREIKEDRTTKERSEPATDPRYYNIDGNYFLIRFADMKTLNVEYLLLVEE